MKYFITSDIPGRIRLRYGRDAFSVAQEGAVEAFFKALPYVEDARANHATGSVLLHYSPDERDALLRAARGLRVSALVPAVHKEGEDIRLIDEDFKRQLLTMVGWQLFRSFLLPSPIRRVVTVWRSLRFLKSGWACLQRGKISVEDTPTAETSSTFLLIPILYMVGTQQLKRQQ